MTLLKELELNSSHTTDIRLSNDIEMWQLAQSTTKNKVTSCTLKTVIYVAKHLLQNKALLLSTVSIFFAEAYTESAVTCNASEIELTLETDDSILRFSSKWLLNNLIVHLHEFLQFKCIHKRFGTIRYHRNGDLITSLSWALSSSAFSECFVPRYSEYSTDEMLHLSALAINDMLHEDFNHITIWSKYQFLTLTDMLEQTNN